MAVDKDAIVADYLKGKNYYELAEKHYEMVGDEAVAKVRAIVEKAEEAGELVKKEPAKK